MVVVVVVVLVVVVGVQTPCPDLVRLEQNATKCAHNDDAHYRPTLPRKKSFLWHATLMSACTPTPCWPKPQRSPDCRVHLLLISRSVLWTSCQEPPTAIPKKKAEALRKPLMQLAMQGPPVPDGIFLAPGQTWAGILAFSDPARAWP